MTESMWEAPGCGWCTDTGYDPVHPDALCPQPDCGAANRERAIHARPAAPVSLADRLAEVLAQHRTLDESGYTDRVWWVRWRCDCGASREWEPDTLRSVVPNVVLGEARTHQAEQLAQTVAGWLVELAAQLDDQAQAEQMDEQATAYQIMADALGVAADKAREVVG